MAIADIRKTIADLKTSIQNVYNDLVTEGRSQEAFALRDAESRLTALAPKYGLNSWAVSQALNDLQTRMGVSRRQGEAQLAAQRIGQLRGAIQTGGQLEHQQIASDIAQSRDARAAVDWNYANRQRNEADADRAAQGLHAGGIPQRQPIGGPRGGVPGLQGRGAPAAGAAAASDGLSPRQRRYMGIYGPSGWVKTAGGGAKPTPTGVETRSLAQPQTFAGPGLRMRQAPAPFAKSMASTNHPMSRSMLATGSRSRSRRRAAIAPGLPGSTQAGPAAPTLQRPTNVVTGWGV